MLDEILDRMRAILNPQGDYLNLKDCGADGWRVEVEYCPDHDAPVIVYYAIGSTLLEALQRLEAGEYVTPLGSRL